MSKISQSKSFRIKRSTLTHNQTTIFQPSLTSSKRKLSSSLPDLHMGKKFKSEKCLVKLRRSSKEGLQASCDSLIEYEVDQLFDGTFFEEGGVSLNTTKQSGYNTNKDDDYNKAISNNDCDILNRIKGLSLIVENKE